MKLIIYLQGGHPNVTGYTRGEYIWMEKHGCYCFKGKDFEGKEFNEVIERACRMYPTLHPLVKAVELDAPAPVAEPEIDIPLEPTLDVALDVVARLAPHRLKASPGPKPKTQAA
jgi:hypothetical protein